MPDYAMNTTGMSESEIEAAHARFAAEDAASSYRGDGQLNSLTATGETDTPAGGLTSKYKRLTLADTELLLRLHDLGKTQPEIAKILECSQSTVSTTLAKLKASPAVTQALMKGESLNRLQDWKRASKVAAKRGDHRPAREWIEAAHPELRPQPANSSGGGGVTINIGIAGQPLRVPDVSISATATSLSPPVSGVLHSVSDEP